MKKLLFIALLMVSVSAFSQIKYEVFNLETGFWSGKKWEWKDPISINLTLTLVKSDIYISDNANTHIVTYNYEGETPGTDADGDSYTSNKWNAYDEKGRQCFFIMQFYKELKYNIYYVMYSDVCFRYYVKKELPKDKFL
jgi:hypothetical protein